MEAAIRMERKIKSLTTRQLVEIFEELSNKTEEEIIIRGAIMDELEKRDLEAFDKWLDDYEGKSIKEFFSIN